MAAPKPAAPAATKPRSSDDRRRTRTLEGEPGAPARASPVAGPEPPPRHRPLRTVEGLGLEIIAVTIAFAIALTIIGHAAGSGSRERTPALGARAVPSVPFERR